MKRSARKRDDDRASSVGSAARNLRLRLENEPNITQFNLRTQSSKILQYPPIVSLMEPFKADLRYVEAERLWPLAQLIAGLAAVIETCSWRVVEGCGTLPMLSLEHPGP